MSEKNTIALISHPDCLLHDTGYGHVERPERVKKIQTALQEYQFKVPAKFYEAPTVTREQLYRVHDKAYVDWIFSISPDEDMIGIDEDTFMNPYTLRAALHAAGAVSLGVDLVMKNQAKVAFCNVRPPGHHAEREKAMGFCFFNNVALGAVHAMTEYNLKRIAIIDFDVHHGNGTQDIFQNNKHVMLCSSFEHPFYPGYEPEMDNEHVICVPLAAGTGGAEFREKVEAAWFEKLAAFQPELIFFSAGFDGHKDDLLGGLKLDVEDYVWVTSQIAKIAQVHCEGRMVSSLEGGYHLAALAECVPAHVNAMIVDK